MAVWVIPLSASKLIHRRLTPVEAVNGIRSLSGFGIVVTTLAQSVLYLRDSIPTRLALKLFRGERAISEFDWSFAPTLSSSERFSTHISSGLHEVLPPLHPDQG